MRNLASLLFFALGMASTALAGMQAGVAGIDITPKESIWLGGFAARTKPSEGVRQEIKAKVLTLRDDGGTISILVTADLLGFTRDLTDRLAARVERTHRIPRPFLLFNASHTHSAPVIGDALAPTYPLTASDRAAIARYTSDLEEQIFDTITASIRSLAPAYLYFGQTLAGLAVNRRRAGHPEYPNVIDSDLPVLTVRAPDGKLRAVVFGYACHNTTLDDNLVSGDWAGYAQSAIEQQFEGSLAMFVEGCGADANPLPRHSEELAAMYGQIIATAVKEVVNGKPRRVDGTLSAAYSEIDLPLDAPPSREEFERRTGVGSGMDRRHAALMLQQMAAGTLPNKHVWQAQVWRIGKDFTFLALGGEVVADYALRFKRSFGFRNLWVAGYCNDVFAYIPSRRVWDEGGYEGGGAMIPYGLPARFQANVEDLVVEAVTALMKSVR